MGTPDILTCWRFHIVHMKQQWRSSRFSFLALFSLLAMALPSSAWACFAQDCAGPLPGSTWLSVQHCDSLECDAPHPECCEPLQLPTNNNSPTTPAKSQTSVSGFLTQPATSAPPASFFAALPTAPPVIKPHYGRSLEICLSASSFLFHSKAPPLSGRSPPTA